MKRLVRPRALVHRGVLECVGFVVREGASRDRGRSRVLSLWSSGSTVFRVADAWVLLRVGAERVRAEVAPGDPIVSLPVPGGALFSSVPLSRDELAAVMATGAHVGDLVRARGGECTPERLGAGDVVEVSAWLELGAVERVEVASLGDPPVAIVVTPEEKRSLKDVLAGITDASAGAFGKAFGAALEALMSRGAGGSSGEGGAVGPSLSERLLRALASMLRWFAPTTPEGPEEAPAGSGTPSAPERAGPSALSRLAGRFDAWIDEFLKRSRVMDLLGARYAQHVMRMMELFQSGKLAEALRMAIPLNFDGGGSAGGSVPWRVPNPRAKLEINPTKGGAGGSVGLGRSLFDRLRDLYRSAAEKLEAEGRVEEAAFVLGELLGDVASAVAMLERNGRLQRAAELAEAARLAPELVVRQWLVAGDAVKAVRHARRTRCFEVAVTRLEASDPAMAVALRREWAELLAASGDLVRAIEVAWPAAPLRAMTSPWLEAAIAMGGAGGARMLARKLAMYPERYEEVLAALDAQRSDESPDGARARVAFVDAFGAGARHASSGVVARSIARTLIEDGARGRVQQGYARVLRLAEISADGALRADLPVWPEVARVVLAARPTPLVYAAGVADVGTRAVHDATLLPDGRMALAMGEAGVWLVNREGRGIARLDAPAHRLVVSDHGDRCLAVARRGRRYRVARVDLVKRRAEVWGEVELDAFATTFDGETWAVAQGRDVMLVDALADRLEALRPVVALDDDVKVTEIVRNAAGLALHADGDAPEVWSYDAHGRWMLRGRLTGKPTPDVVSVAAFDAAGARLCVTKGARWGLVLHDGKPLALEIDLGHASAPCALAGAALDARWVAVAARGHRAVKLWLHDRATAKTRWAASLDGSQAASMRFADGHLVVCDERGRVLAMELDHGDFVRDLRM